MVYLLDCTLRDGGYYNNWDFSKELIQSYLGSMDAISADFVEIGFRSLSTKGFKGGCAYASDFFINNLNVPKNLKIGVMVNASELLNYPKGVIAALQELFPQTKNSLVKLVRVACHVHEFAKILPGCTWLKEQGYVVGANLMQIADRTEAEVEEIAKAASQHPLDVLYFADSMGSMFPHDVTKIISSIRKYWKGAIGVHTHDNIGLALSNSLQAVKDGATWIDSTVTGMGRGPGNAKTEFMAVELAEIKNQNVNITPLLNTIRKYFKPLQDRYNWGTNLFYFLAGKYGIHPTYIQEMLSDPRYGEEDIIAVIEHLRAEGGKKYSFNNLEAGRKLYNQNHPGTCKAIDVINEKEVLLLGTGPGVKQHKESIEEYIRTYKPVVLALNTQSEISADLINYRTACHPMRLLADCDNYQSLPQPLITPFSALPDVVKEGLKNKQVFDFGLSVQEGAFVFKDKDCTIPTALVAAYSLAFATSGHAKRILLAGFDGYAAGDPRNNEMETLLQNYSSSDGARSLVAVTPTVYDIDETSIYRLVSGEA